jgi:hypothetical protein
VRYVSLERYDLMFDLHQMCRMPFYDKTRQKQEAPLVTIATEIDDKLAEFKIDDFKGKNR